MLEDSIEQAEPVHLPRLLSHGPSDRDTLQEQLGRLERNFKALQGEKDNLQDENDELQDYNDSLRDDIERLEDDNDKLEEDNDRLQDDNNKLTASRNDYRKKYRDVQFLKSTATESIHKSDNPKARTLRVDDRLETVLDGQRRRSDEELQKALEDQRSKHEQALEQALAKQKNQLVSAFKASLVSDSALAAAAVEARLQRGIESLEKASTEDSNTRTESFHPEIEKLKATYEKESPVTYSTVWKVEDVRAVGFVAAQIPATIMTQLAEQMAFWDKKKPEWVASPERRCAASIVAKKGTSGIKGGFRYACKTCTEKKTVCVAVVNKTMELLPVKRLSSGQDEDDLGTMDEEYWVKGGLS